MARRTRRNKSKKNTNNKARDALQRIQDQVTHAEHMLHERLPHQQQIVLVDIALKKWLQTTLWKNDSNGYDDATVLAKLKKAKQEISSYQYRVLEQGEILTRLLCDLDLILSEGDQTVRKDRKSLVLHIQELLNFVDEMKLKSEKIRSFGQRVLQQHMDILMKKVEENVKQQDNNVAKEATEIPNNMENTKVTESVDDVNDRAEDENKDNDSDEDNDEDMEDHESMDDDNDDANDNGDNDEDDESDSDEDDDENKDDMEDDHFDTPNTYEEAINALPIWRPRCTIQNASDAICVSVNLHGVDPKNVNVTVSTNGELVISGYKLPTRRDIQVTRSTGVATFGRFVVRHQLPRNLIDADESSFRYLPNGMLEVHLPRRVSLHSSLHGPAFYSTPRSYSGLVW